MGVRSFLVTFSLALSVAIGLLLRAPAPGPSAADKGKADSGITIGLSLDTQKEARWVKDSTAFQKRAEELGARVIVTSANGDDNRQVADVASLITSRVDVIVIVPHDGKAMAKGVALAHEAGIPVIAYDRLIKDSDVDLYVTFDNRRVGQLQAQFILDSLAAAPPPLDIVRIYGAKTDNNAFMFKEGQDDVILPAIAAGKVRVLHEDWADDWKPENAKRIMNAALTKHGKAIVAVLASNDSTAGGAITALREEGVAGGVLVTGQDADLVACQRIASGEQAMSIYKPVEKLARGAAEVAVALGSGKPIIATGKTPNGKIDVPSIFHDVVTVTKANLRETVVSDGFHAEKDIFQGEPAAKNE